MKFISVFVALWHLHALRAQSSNFSQISGVIDRLHRLTNLTMPAPLEFKLPSYSMLSDKKCCMPVFTELLKKALDTVPAEHNNVAEEIRDLMPAQATVTGSCEERCKTKMKMTKEPFKPFIQNLQNLMKNDVNDVNLEGFRKAAADLF